MLINAGQFGNPRAPEARGFQITVIPTKKFTVLCVSYIVVLIGHMVRPMLQVSTEVGNLIHIINIKGNNSCSSLYLQ